MKRLLIALFGLLVASVSAQVIPVTGTQTAAPTSSIIGQLQTTTGGTINNGTLTFSLSQPAVVSGSSSVVGSATSCYTSSAGNVVGVPDPILSPTLIPQIGGSGTLPAATYYVKITYYSAGSESLPSPEAVATLNGIGSLVISYPPSQPGFPVIGIRVYASTTQGAETLQISSGSFSGSGVSLTNPLIAGPVPPIANNSVCNIYFSDQLIPTGTYYTVNLTNRNGSTVSGYPQTWCTYGGAGGTINVSNGAPTGNCNVNGVFYPTPVMANPQNNATQSISGPVSFTTVTACNLNGTLTLNPGCFAPGGDIGAQVNAAYAACPINGCIIQIPSGSYAFSTPIAFGTQVNGLGNINSGIPVVLRCGGGTNGYNPTNGPVQLIYTGSTGAAITFNDGGFTGSGMVGCTERGSGSGLPTAGLVCASSVGLYGAGGNGICEGHYFEANDISGFGVGVQIGGYAFLNTFHVDSVHDNGKNLTLTGLYGNEGNKFIGGILSNQSTIVQNCVDTTLSTQPYDMEFFGVSLDGCGVNMVGAGTRFRFIGSHFEDPSGSSITPFITLGTHCSTCNLQLDATDIQEDGAPASGQRLGFIQNNNTDVSPAAVIIYGGHMYGAAYLSGFPIIHDAGGANVASVQNVFKSGSASSDVDTGAQWVSFNYGTLNIGGSQSPAVKLNGNLLISSGAPTIASGFGSTPFIGNSNGTASFTVNVGSGGSASAGTLQMPFAAPTGWTCTCEDISTISSTVARCRATPGTVSTVGLANLNSSAGSANWAANDLLQVSCFAR